jgi:AraC-like DNA-binding protein
MPKLSIPLIVFFVMLLLAMRTASQGNAHKILRPFLALILIAATQALLVSLRWDFGYTELRPLQIIISCIIPALAWLSFQSLVADHSSTLKFADLANLLPAALAAIAIGFFPDIIDFVVIATSVIYGVLCLRLFVRGQNELTNVGLSNTLNVRRALGLVTFALFGSGLVDLFVVLDFMTGGGHAPLLIGTGNLVWLALIGFSAAITTRSLPDEDDDDSEPRKQENSPEEDQKILAIVDAKLIGDQLYKEPNLTLGRLARRVGIPSRQISIAINRLHDQNVSQYVNGLRIKEACRLLTETVSSVTSIIYDSGFQTKSNFNREFLRQTGKTPRQWRKQ